MCQQYYKRPCISHRYWFNKDLIMHYAYAVQPYCVYDPIGDGKYNCGQPFHNDRSVDEGLEIMECPHCRRLRKNKKRWHRVDRKQYPGLVTSVPGQQGEPIDRDTSPQPSADEVEDEWRQILPIEEGDPAHGVMDKGKGKAHHTSDRGEASQLPQDKGKAGSYCPIQPNPNPDQGEASERPKDKG